MYQCFHCLQNAVVWDADFDSFDYGYFDPGIIHACHCTNFGAEITYFIPINEESEDGDNIRRQE